MEKIRAVVNSKCVRTTS